MLSFYSFYGVSWRQYVSSESDPGSGREKADVRAALPVSCRRNPGGESAGREKLPSKRLLCAELGVSRSTVEAAYDLLCGEGYAVSRPRSGFFAADVLAQAEIPAPPVRKQPKPASREDNLFSTSAVDVSLFPYASWAKLYREVVYHSPELLQRGQAQGEPELREALARMLSEYRSVRCSPEQIVVGSGLETLLSQLITLLGQEAVYALEDPGYPYLERALSARNGAIRFIPLDGDGMDTAALEQSGANVAYLTPSHQFPMGVTMPASRRSRMLRWASERSGSSPQLAFTLTTYWVSGSRPSMV